MWSDGMVTEDVFGSASVGRTEIKMLRPSQCVACLKQSVLAL